LNTILFLIVKDLRRDWKHPWTLLLFSAMPFLMTALMAAIFGGRAGTQAIPVMHMAILDQDKDMVSGMLRSMSSQGDAAQKLQLHFVDSREEGVRLLEKHKASAFIVLPENLTDGLLNGNTNIIEFYENPAEQILPKVARQGVSLLAAGLSGAAVILGEPLKEIRNLFKQGGFPAEAAVLATAAQSVQKLSHLKSYLFPPLIQFQTIAAADWNYETNRPASKEQQP
jgi:hypothetical protein